MLFVFLLILAVILTMFPKAIWFLSTGWRFKNAEPSDISILLYRIIGIVMGIIVVFMLILMKGDFFN